MQINHIVVINYLISIFHLKIIKMA